MDTEKVGRLLSLIYHEVRGPLGVMRGYLRLLEQREPELTDQQRHAVAAALKAGDRATEVLAQLSLLAEMTRREMPLEFQSTGLAELLGAVAEGTALTPAHNPKATPAVAPVAPRQVRADWNLLRLALTGLVAAIVRAQPSDVPVTIGTRDDVRDDVPGVAIQIAAGDIADATEQPLDETRGGLGLDLPIAAAVITSHRGDVQEWRRGTRLVGMVVWLPLAE